WARSTGMAAKRAMGRLLQSGGPRVTPRQEPQLTRVENSVGNSDETGAIVRKRRILAQSGTTFAPSVVVGRAAAIMLLTIAGVVAAFAFAPDSLVPADPAQRIIRELSRPAIAPVVQVGGYWREERIQRGDTLGSVLARLGIDNVAAQNFLRT